MGWATIVPMKNYAHPEALVDPRWVADHLHDPRVRIVEAHFEPAPREAGRIPGAVSWNVVGTLLKPDWQVNFDRQAVENLCGQSGIGNDTTVVACSRHGAIAHWLFWFLKSVGHADVRVLNGGLKKWTADGHALTTDVPAVSPARYAAREPDPALRALLPQVRAAIDNEKQLLLDVRTTQEYRGELFLMKPPGDGERAGHLPGSIHIHYEDALDADDTFKSADELTALYTRHGVTADRDIIVYCAIGMRSAHTWFVLTQLLGYQAVRSFDASWNVWGRLPDTPVEV